MTHHCQADSGEYGRRDETAGRGGDGNADWRWPAQSAVTREAVPPERLQVGGGPLPVLPQPWIGVPVDQVLA